LSVDTNPLVAAAPEEIPLRNAPLVRVIAQVRFPVIASIDNRGFIASFQEALRDAYPVLRPEMTQGFVVGSQGLTPAPSQMIWRLRDVQGQWRVSLAPDFIALETTAYVSRSDFLARLHGALRALHEHIGPKIIDRMGLRYIDRVLIHGVDDIATLVRREVIGILATPLAASAHQALSESLFEVPNTHARLLARWGQVPPHGTVDPSAIEPVDRPSWILDLDMFSADAQPFDPEALVAEVRTYAERIYAVFRWAVTEDFLRRYGGAL
jgi:uncharacterized protein (TIGR04255 family)